MAPKYSVGQKLDFLGQPVIVKAVEPCFADGAIYLCAVGDVALPMRFLFCSFVSPKMRDLPRKFRPALRCFAIFARSTLSFFALLVFPSFLAFLIAVSSRAIWRLIESIA